MLIHSLDLPGIRKIASGKVRGIFDLGEHLLLAALHRLHAPSRKRRSTAALENAAAPAWPERVAAVVFLVTEQELAHEVICGW